MDATLNILSLIFGLGGSYYSLKNIIIANVKTQINQNSIKYQQSWGKMSLFHRFVFRFFHLNKENLLAPFLVYPNPNNKSEMRAWNIFNFGLFFLAFVLQIYLATRS
ncbi:hypothetical protein A2661_01930 [Candidatus Giovannonibacteria bacterium RIFCSPHIGHO2_01_FULL_45_24]|uniref:Uncharacterized protein n=1 Tax=Candidatus Giovannonibacteria bacterium RIFCSPLOWO2_01_FULL_46_32 TaxID=1798353 RepID=A0A1F5XHV8_9BACT|nr:MAG: hypothetical protein A2661_01930 [Candidatus Giovannonibacteria bacterium RIFCSPHIGHO2_01_FULL_45_24]OGF87457.1 MAG: hypothetical protein A3B19_02650 [Candidatus Giovannonibacteria bacterium RIFCSPLOWO2_01_FULL_46_32]